ncbi:hypothetical protein [Halobacteriovorax sp.]|uniref:hypothetical protein n=1 Tax=Halobacteriovorax sp. TaxID=2020862 RepID=UPI003AF270D4
MTKRVSDNDSVNGVHMSGNSSQNAAAKSAEKGFSENELDDIMAEFASLDAELTTSGPLAEEDQVKEEVPAAEAEPVAEEVNPLDELEAATQAPVEEELHVEDFPAAEEFEEISAEATPAPEEKTEIISETDLMEASSEDEANPTPSIAEAFGEGFDEAEMDAIMKDLEDIDASAGPALEMEEEVEPEAHEENVVAMKKPEEVVEVQPTTVATPAAGTGEVAFSAAGNMNFNVNLTIAGSQATLSVQDGCFKLTMNGVDISITEEGCKAFIEGGVNFNIPLPTDKKDVA